MTSTESGMGAAGSVGPDLHEVQGRALRGSGWGLVCTLASLPLTILSTVVLARQFGVGGFGQYAVYAFVVPTAVELSDLGLTSGFLQRGAAAYGAGDQATLNRMCGQSLTWTLLRWPVLLGGLAIFLDDAIAAGLLCVAAVSSVFGSGVMLRMVCTVRNVEISRTALLAAILSAGATVAAARLGAPPARVFAVGFAVQTTTMCLLVIHVWGDSVALRACFRPISLSGAREDLVFGGKTYLSGHLAALTSSRSELLFFAPGQQLARGVYAAAYTVGSRLTLPIDALYSSVGSSLAVVQTRGDAAERAAKRALRLSGALFSVVAGPGVLLALAGAELFFPPDYEGVALASVMLAAGSLAVSGSNPISALLYARREVRPIIVGAGIALTVNLALSAFLIPRYGLGGAVGANAGAAVVYVAALAIPLRRDRKLGATIQGYIRTVGIPLALAVVCGVAVSAIANGLVRLTVGLLLAGVQPLAAIRYLPCLIGEDFSALRRHVPERLAGLLRCAEHMMLGRGGAD